MPPPPPPPKAHRKAPPPPPLKKGITTPPAPPEVPWPPFSPDLTRFEIERAVWVHGGYPQVPWNVALKVLLARCKRETPFPQVSSIAIWMLDRGPRVKPPFYLDDFTPEAQKRFPFLVRDYAKRPHRPKTIQQIAEEHMNARVAAQIAANIRNGTF